MSGILLGTLENPRHGAFLSADDLVSKDAPILDSVDDKLTDNKIGDDVLDSAAEDFGAAAERSQAMGIALSFIEEGDYTFDSVDSMVRGIVEIDELGESDPTDEEEQEYNELAHAVLDSFIALGADADQALAFMQDEDDFQGEALGSFLKSEMDEQVLDDATIINHHAVSQNLELAGDDGVMDAARIKKIRNGRVVWVKKRIGPKKRMSAKQKMALKKARMKSNNATAKAKRAKSSRLAKSMGM